MKKRWIVRLAVFCLMMVITGQFMLGTAAASGGSLRAECDKQTLKPGDSFSLTVSAEDVKDLAGFLIYVYGDTEVFQLSKEADGETYEVASGSLTQDGTIISNVYEDQGWQTLWFNTENIQGSGELFTFQITVDPEAAGGDYEFKLGYSTDNTIDVDANPQQLLTSGTTIHVDGEEKPEGEEEEQQEEPGAEKNGYRDVPADHWAYGPIMQLSDRKIVSGSGDGCFYPDRQITRAEFVKMLTKIAGANTETAPASVFTDVAEDAWYCPYVMWAYTQGVVNGISETEFGPNQPLTREQMAALIVRLCKKLELELQPIKEKTTFTDADQIADYAASAIEAVQRAGIINGYPDGSFGPKGNTRRSETAKVLSGILLQLDQRQAEETQE